MIKFKKLAALGLAAVMSMSLLAGCGGSDANEQTGGQTNEQENEQSGEQPEGDAAAAAETKHHKIGVGLYTDQGQSITAIHAYLDGIQDVVDCEFQYVTLSTYDEATNLSMVQDLISSGCEGIILTADMGTNGILEECASAGVYVAGFLCDYNQSFFTAHDEVFGSEYFLGTVCDGYAVSTKYGELVAEKVSEGGYKNIGVLTFPSWAYPNQAEVVSAFKTKLAELNPEATVYDTVELQFSPLEDTYLSEHPDMDCLFSVAAGASFVYPVLVAANKTDVALYTTGFEATDDVENFGTSGNGCFKGVMCSAPEAIAYPLCLLIDKLNGASYSDMPEMSERVDCEPYIVLSDEDMAKMQKTLYYSADYADAAITGEDILNMCASYNADASYADLVAAMGALGLQ